MSTIMLAAGFVIAGFSSMLCFYFYNKNKEQQETNLKSLEKEANFLQKQSELEKQISKNKSQLNELFESKTKSDQSLTQFKENYHKESLEYEEQISLSNEKLKKLEQQKDHFEDQARSLLEQVKEADQEKKSYRLKLEKISEQEKNEFHKRRDEEHSKLKDMSNNLDSKTKTIHQLQKKVDAITKELEQVKPQDIEKIQRKYRQYEYFCKTLQGQRQMIDDRMNNWETALKMLSSSILMEKRPLRPLPAKLGELVATALEAMKQEQMIVDDEVIAPSKVQGSLEILGV